MIATKPRPPYRGITWHAGRWLVKLRHKGKDVTIGHYERPEDAAWAADFARYALRGLNPACWGHKVIKPNFPPCCTNLPMQNHVLRVLFVHRLLELDTMAERRKEYDAAAARPAPATP
jgi:hypothetical protein